MDTVIVTATNINKTYLYDIEVPVSMPIGTLKRQIADTLNGYDVSLDLNPETVEIICNRLGRQLLSEDTFESVGVWNGDFITVIEG